MRSQFTLHLCLTGAVVILALCRFAPASADEPIKRQWTATSTNGAAVEVPSPRVTLLAFVRPDQAQSRAALDHIAAAVREHKDVRVVIVMSGERAREAPAPDTADACWPVVIDPDFAASGQFSVHVWPTTVIVKPSGEETAHLAGMSEAFAADLRDHLAFATGAIDAKELARRLADHEIVGSGSAGKTDRHLTLATQLTDSGRLDDATAALKEGLVSRPGDVKLSLQLARVHLLKGEAREALQLLDGLPAGAIPAWQLNLLRGQALVALEQWDDARAALPDAFKLNPNPADAHYLAGLVAQHDSNWQQAAEEFRKAYELSKRRP